MIRVRPLSDGRAFPFEARNPKVDRIVSSVAFVLVIFDSAEAIVSDLERRPELRLFLIMLAT